MNKYTPFLLLNILMLSIFSSFASDLPWKNYGNEPISSRKIISQVSQLDFWTVVKALKDEEPINIGRNKYKVLSELPICSESSGERYQGNPCYELGIGPQLLQKDQINRLPNDPGVKWTYHVGVVSERNKTWFLTLRYMAANNPDWADMNSPKDPYWDERIDTHGGRHYTVNFLLQLLE